MNHLKLRDKLIIIYVVCVLVPVLLSNIIFYIVTTTNIKNQKTVDAHIAIENLQQQHIDSVTFWGVAEDYTWLDNFPVVGRKNWPFVFDEKHQPNQSFWNIVKF